MLSVGTQQQTFSRQNIMSFIILIFSFVSYFCPLLNISYCPSSEIDLAQGKNLIVVVYNALGWERDDVIRIPVSPAILFLV
ncbi:unnamed protein product [Ilex paraguariensis]|uniref:Uncharacterized protein n=1 Tax=Ilex paraguariensis TaxID=185542 RepID=A0ABC8T9R2_9AQUA